MRRGAPLALTAVLAAAGCSTLVQVPGTELLYRRVTPEVAFYLLRDSPDALVLDLRPAGSPATLLDELGRSRSLPLAELPARLAELEPYRERTFLVFCGGDPECGIAAMHWLVESGCAYAVLIDGPLDDWQPPAAAGAPATVAAAGAPAAVEPPAAAAEVERAAAAEPEAPPAAAWSPWL